MNNLNLKKILKYFLLIVFLYFTLNSIRIYQYSKQITTETCDVAIVLGAGTNDGILSNVFKERINHSIKLYHQKRVIKIIYTGGFGKGQTISDSQVAKEYAIKNGIPENDILIEEKSQYTIENLIESKPIMDSLDFKTALLVSDPLHMKRAVSLANKLDINCFSSPTQTSMYQSRKTKFRFLMYETFYFTLGEISGRN